MALPLSEFVPVWGFLALNILSPGPNVLNTMTTAMGSGRRAGLTSAAGVAVGIGLWCLGMSLGMAALFAALPAARATRRGGAAAALRARAAPAIAAAVGVVFVAFAVRLVAGLLAAPAP